MILVVLLVEVTLVIIDHTIISTSFKFLTIPTGDDRILACKSKEFSEEILKSTDASHDHLAPKLTFICNGKIAEKFEGSSLKQEKKNLIKEMQ